MKNQQKLILLILSFVAMLLANTAMAQSVTWEDDFTSGVANGQDEADVWSAFVVELNNAASVGSVTMSGTFDPVGITCSDPAATQQIADFITTNTTGIITCDGHEWNYCDRGSWFDLWIDPPSACDSNNCPDPGYIVRPLLTNSNFGGVNTDTCGGPSQTMVVQFDDAVAGEAKANFKVTKTFSDGSDDAVEVTLTCNGGLPLVQSFTIAGDDPNGVTFVVTDLGDTGATCTVTETGGPDGYTPELNGGAGCSWDGVTGGLYTCAITNEADPATFTVNKVWEVNEEGGGDEIDRVAEVMITCDAEIEGGYQDDDYPSEDDRIVAPVTAASAAGSEGLDVPAIMPFPAADWMLDGTIVGDGSLVATVDTSMGPATCSAEETSEQSGVESTDDCGPREIGAGETSECTITNTVFFEGIPSLNQYGLAIMALLMLGMGMVGFRRFV